MKTRRVQLRRGQIAPALVTADASAEAPLDHLPAALMPVGSRPMIEHVIGALGARGWQEIVVEAGEHRECLDRLLDGGAPWDLDVRVIERADRPLRSRASIHLLGHQLGSELSRHDRRERENSLETNTIRGFARTNLALLEGRCPYVDEPAIECAPRVRRATHHTRISRKARIIGPVILGEDVIVRAGAQVGPYVVLTSGVVVDKNAHLSHSILAGGLTLKKGGHCHGILSIGDRVLPSSDLGVETPRELGLRNLGTGTPLFGHSVAATPGVELQAAPSGV